MTQPIAWISCSSQSNRPAGVPFSSYVTWAQDTAPRLNRHGITRVFLHNPGGQWPGVDASDDRPMRCDQWLRAEAAKLPFADRSEFREAVTILKKHGVKEVIVYLGSPTQLMDVESQLPECTAPFLAGHEGVVSFCFDAAFHDGCEPNSKQPDIWRQQWAKNAPCTRAMLKLSRKCRAVYIEPRLMREHLAAGLGNIIAGTIAEAEVDADQFPDLTGQPGETIRATKRKNHSGEWPEVELWEPGVTRLLRSEFNWGPAMDKGAK
jgi:hypothetical protein